MKYRNKREKGKMRVNPELSRDSDLKKQSQFVGGSIGIKSVLIMVYGDIGGLRQ
jgi:hypothetical protein